MIERLIAAVIASPLDDDLRLVCADCMDDAGLFDRAAFIRAAVALHRLGPSPSVIEVRHVGRGVYMGTNYVQGSATCIGDRATGVTLNGRRIYGLVIVGTTNVAVYLRKADYSWDRDEYRRLRAEVAALRPPDPEGVTLRWDRGFVASAKGPLDSLRAALPALVREHPISYARALDVHPVRNRISRRFAWRGKALHVFGCNTVNYASAETAYAALSSALIREARGATVGHL